MNLQLIYQIRSLMMVHDYHENIIRDVLSSWNEYFWWMGTPVDKQEYEFNETIRYWIAAGFSQLHAPDYGAYVNDFLSPRKYQESNYVKA